MRILIVFGLFFVLNYNAYALCTCYTESVTDTWKTNTTDMIGSKETTLKKEVENYKTVLKAKKKAMIELLRTVKGIEALMKKNQVERKKSIKYWNDIAQIHAITLPH